MIAILLKMAIVVGLGFLASILLLFVLCLVIGILAYFYELYSVFHISINGYHCSRDSSQKPKDKPHFAPYINDSIKTFRHLSPIHILITWACHPKCLIDYIAKHARPRRNKGRDDNSLNVVSDSLFNPSNDIHSEKLYAPLKRGATQDEQNP
jgi:hypothetical protein